MRGTAVASLLKSRHPKFNSLSILRYPRVVLSVRRDGSHLWKITGNLSRFPKWCEQDGLVLILGGDLDRQDRLHAALELSSDAAQALTDAALVLATWQRWGESGLARLQGPIALVLADLRDSQRPRIVLYREPLGRRGLYYFSAPQLLLVADEPAALLAHPAVSSEPDEHWLAAHFALARPADNRTAFRTICKLLPGERLIWTPAAIRLHREPLVFGQQRLSYRSDQEYADHFRTLLDQSVARCLRDSGERTGIMLSGGMDSGSLAALAQRRLSGEERALTAYSWSLPGYPNADESAEITTCAHHVGCSLQLLLGSAEWPMRDPATWPVNPNSPVANGFRRLKLAVYRAAAADGCRVILNGAVGDSLYPHPSCYLLDGWRDRRFGWVVREIARIGRAGSVLGLWRDPATRRLGKHLLGWRRTRPVSAPIWLSASARQYWREVGNPWPPEAADHARPDHYVAALGQWAADGVSEEAFFANRCGLERREPYHDPDLIDFMLSVSSDYCYRNGHTKWLARQAMEGLLPEAIRQRPRGGLLYEFFDYGFRREHAALERLLKAPDAAWPAYVDHGWLMRALNASEPSEWERLLIWYCAAFELWRRALSGDYPGLLRFAHGKA